MIVLGIDPGIATTGIAVLCENRNATSILHTEAFLTSKSMTIPKRLEMLYNRILNIIKKYKPDVCVLESLFFNTNAKTALIIGQSRGIVQLAMAICNIPVTEYTPLQVKMALTGYGRADKSQIQIMVKQIFKLPRILTPDDVADSAAIALTHCFSYKMTNSIKYKV